MGFGAGFVAAASAPQLQPKIVYDAPRNLILNRQGVSDLTVKPARPERKLVFGPDQLRVNPKLLARSNHGSLNDVIGS
jgi:hypothetical protein